MKRRYIRDKAVKRARLARVMAKVIDAFIVLILSIFMYPIGTLLAFSYIAVCDAIQGGQSVGKKFIGIKVISLEDGQPCSLKQSFIRNLPFLVPIFFSNLPFIGWIFSILIGIPLILLELYLLFRLDSGYRLGDVMADTSVMGHDANGEFPKDLNLSKFGFKKGNVCTNRNR